MIAIVFPGQGSQSVGMLQGWANQEPIITETFAQASNRLNYDLWELIQKGPEEKLNQTEFTQPALLTVSVALYRVLMKHVEVKPDFMAGHSLGEYSALVCAGALGFEDAVKLVEMRGRFMQTAVPVGKGAMAAIVGLTAHQVQSICESASEKDSVVTPANYNADAQIVVAGVAAAVDRAVEAALAQGAKIAKRLPMSVPSHCALMKPAADELARYLEKITIHTPQISVIHNVDVAEHKNPQDIKKVLIEQLYSPVCWTETIKKLERLGVKKVVECGPGKVLAGLCKRIKPSPEVAITFNAPEDLETTLTVLG